MFTYFNNYNKCFHIINYNLKVKCSVRRFVQNSEKSELRGIPGEI